MSVIATALQHMLAAGMPADAIVAAVSDMEASIARDPVAEKRRAYDRERKRVAKSTGIPPETTENAEIPEPPLSLSPNENNSNPHTHTPGGDTPRARKGDFPKPDWADAQIWADFLQNRKSKRLSNTATAHKGFLADIARLSDDEWPPGRLLEHAVARGWGAIFDPRNRNGSNVATFQNRTPTEPVDPMVRAVARRQAERASGRLHEADQRAGHWP